jgi:hypothetical protein
MSNPNKEEPVYFHPEQVKYLEKVFPDVVFSYDVTEDHLRYYNGQRSIIQFIRSRQRSR